MTDPDAPELRILGGGAVHGLVRALAPGFAAATGLGVGGEFGAVQGLRQRLVEGEAADLAVLTAAILGELAGRGLVRAGTIRDVGRVATAVAVRDGYEPPDLADRDALRSALLDADAIYFPDPKLATAGIHFRSVMDGLGILDAVADRLRVFPNGATAMRALAASTDRRPIGCTQTTEIVATPDVRLAADLPPGCDLVTTYTAGVCAAARRPKAAARFAAMLAAPEAAGIRRGCGFQG